MAVPDAEHAKRVAERVFAAPSSTSVRLVHADRNVLYRVEEGECRYALKFFVANANGLARELAARAFVEKDIPTCVVVGASAGTDDIPPYLATSWSNGRPLSSIMAAAVDNEIDAAFEEAGLVAGRLAILSPAIVANACATLPAGMLFNLRWGSTAFSRKLGDVIRLLGELIDDETAGRVRHSLESADGGGWYTKGVITHGDFKPNNLLFDEHGHIDALIDWELAAIDSPWSDLSQLLRHALTDEQENRIAVGYTRCVALPSEWRRLARMYDLARVAVGLSQADREADDVSKWVDYLRGCLGAVESSDPSAARLAAAALLRPIGPDTTL